MVEATKKAFGENYANFKGRTNRADFWWAILGFALAYMAASVIEGLLLGRDSYILTRVFLLATFIPLLALEVRRLHDINKSGWFVLLGFIPFVGEIILIILYCGNSVNENNAY